MDLGQKINEYIKDNSINKSDVCLKMGISEKKFNKILEKRNMTSFTYYTICKALNVSLDLFFE